MDITYSTERGMTAEQFVDLLNRSTLGERRPVDDMQCMQAMVTNADLTVTAWDGETLVGVARSVTDFSYCCYLSDLAVDEKHQRKGIGRRLIEMTREKLEPTCQLILLAAPAAADYYQGTGFEHHSRAWVLPAGKPLT